MDKNTMDKSKIPFYASKLAQSFIDFELSEWEKNNITTEQRMIDRMIKNNYTFDDIGLMDAVDILRSRDSKKARQAASTIQNPEGKQDAERSIRCFEERCIR